MNPAGVVLGFARALAWPASAIAAVIGSTARSAPPEAALRRHDEMAAAWQATGLDAGDAGAVFAHVFSRLPDCVPVLPTENYSYWQLIVDGREFAGQLPARAGRARARAVAFCVLGMGGIPRWHRQTAT